MLSYFVSSAAALTPALLNRNQHFAILTWFRYPYLHLPFVHDVGPRSVLVSPNPQQIQTLAACRSVTFWSLRNGCELNSNLVMPNYTNIEETPPQSRASG
jgi:hypothetical protein